MQSSRCHPADVTQSMSPERRHPDDVAHQMPQLANVIRQMSSSRCHQEKVTEHMSPNECHPEDVIRPISLSWCQPAEFTLKTLRSRRNQKDVAQNTSSSWRTDFRKPDFVERNKPYADRRLERCRPRRRLSTAERVRPWDPRWSTLVGTRSSFPFPLRSRERPSSSSHHWWSEITLIQWRNSHTRIQCGLAHTYWPLNTLVSKRPNNHFIGENAPNCIVG